MTTALTRDPPRQSVPPIGGFSSWEHDMSRRDCLGCGRVYPRYRVPMLLGPCCAPHVVANEVAP